MGLIEFRCILLFQKCTLLKLDCESGGKTFVVVAGCSCGILLDERIVYSVTLQIVGGIIVYLFVILVYTYSFCYAFLCISIYQPAKLRLL